MKPSGYCTRRRFIGTAAQLTALAGLGVTFRAAPAMDAVDHPKITLYDPRFAAAETWALNLAGAGRLLTTRGDPTELLLQLAARGCDQKRLRLQGVTTESIPFCLQQWMPGGRLRLRRLDRDLFTWDLEGL